MDVLVEVVDAVGPVVGPEVGGRVVVVDGRDVVGRGRVVAVLSRSAGDRPPEPPDPADPPEPPDPPSDGVGPGLAGGRFGVGTVAGGVRTGPTGGSGPRCPRS